MRSNTCTSWSRLASTGVRSVGIGFFSKADVAGDAVLCQPLHVLEHDVNVDRLTLDRPLVGKDLHAINELHDAIGLVANQSRERSIVVAD